MEIGEQKLTQPIKKAPEIKAKLSVPPTKPQINKEPAISQPQPPQKPSIPVNKTVEEEQLKEKTVNKKVGKEHKTEKIKPVKAKKSVNKGLIFGILAGIILVAGGICAYLFIPRQEKLATPELFVNGIAGRVILSVDENPDCDYYVFNYKNNTTNKVYVKESNENQAILVLEPGNYTFSAQCCKNNEKYSSDLSNTLAYSYYKQLETPNVQKTSDGLGLSWPSIKNTKEYRIYYAENKFFTLSGALAGTIKFNYSDHFNGSIDAGKYNLYVRAVANESSFYSDSELSSSYEYEYYTTLKEVYETEYNVGPCTLKFNASPEETKTTLFEIEVDCGSNKKFKIVYDSLTVKLTHIVYISEYLNNKGYDSSEVIGITITAKSNSEFISDSTPVSVPKEKIRN